jgi:CheY-like chemotaxis protein
MAERPVILVVDDEPAGLATMLDALTRRFGGDYRVVPYLSAHAALDAVSRFKTDSEEMALVIADQWMPEMTGNEFLGRVRSIEPMAKRALLVAWGGSRGLPRHPAGLLFVIKQPKPQQPLHACRGPSVSAGE